MIQFLERESLRVITTAFPHTDVDTISVNFVKSTSLMLAAESVLRGCTHMPETFDYLRANPRTFFYLVRSLDSAIDTLNKTALSGFSSPYYYARGIAPALREASLPKVLSLARQKDPEVCDVFQRSLAMAVLYMKNGEHKNELPEDIFSRNQWIEGHLRGKTPIARAAAILMHGYDLTVANLPESKGRFEVEDTINPLCEVLAVAYRGSLLFETLYDPEDLNWYGEGYEKE